MLQEIESQLETPHGVAMFNLPYSRMRDDVGRAPRKSTRSAENGAV